MQVVNAHTVEPPEHLKTLGPYPTEPQLQDLWRRTAIDIEHYRAEHNITDRDHPLGAAPRYDHDHYDDYRTINDDIRWAQRSLDPTPEHVAEREIERGMSLGL